jgi:RNA polymerase sigma-70 factor (ECF subfamily)
MVPWIYRITRNAVADHYRKKRKSDGQVVLDWNDDHNEFNACVAYCLKVLMTTLPEKYRTPLELTELENVSQYELAERLNMTYSGARSRVQRARKMLKDRLEELYNITTDAYGNVIACEDRTPCCCNRKC